jgi:exonuclease VII large subunit
MDDAQEQEALLETYGEMLAPFMQTYAQQQRQRLLQVGEEMRLQEQQDQVHLAAKVTHWAGVSLDATLLRAIEPYAPRMESVIPLDPDTLEKKDKKSEAAREGWKKRKLAKEEAMEQEARNKMIRAEARRKATEERARLAAGASLSNRVSCLC